MLPKLRVQRGSGGMAIREMTFRVSVNSFALETCDVFRLFGEAELTAPAAAMSRL